MAPFCLHYVPPVVSHVCVIVFVLVQLMSDSALNFVLGYEILHRKF